MEIETAERVRQAADIFERYSDQIRAMISFNVKEQSMADDVFQNLFLSIVHKPIPPEVDRVEAYLFRTVTNDVIDETRRTNGHRNIVRLYGRYSNSRSMREGPENDSVESEEIHDMLRAMRKRLPPREAQALIHRHLCDSEVSEGARKMNVDKRTFSRYVSRGKQRIRQYIENGQGEEK
ncbi:MAG: RNA polymerase sigma factor [Planctomycetota bacterium]|jgi:RNA polymerase sigma factor (sigma-70 family)